MQEGKEPLVRKDMAHMGLVHKEYMANKTLQVHILVDVQQDNKDRMVRMAHMVEEVRREHILDVLPRILTQPRILPHSR